MANPLTYSLNDVAALLRKSPTYFSTIRPRLEGFGFPKPLPGLGAVWSKPQVDAWIAGNGDLTSDLALDAASRAVEAARAGLEETYAGGAS